MDMNSEMTDEEMDRIDHIQQLTYDYINKMLPDGKAVEYDLDMIDDVIEAVWGAKIQGQMKVMMFLTTTKTLPWTAMTSTGRTSLTRRSIPSAASAAGTTTRRLGPVVLTRARGPDI